VKKAEAEKLMRQFPLSTKGVENIGYAQGEGVFGESREMFFSDTNSSAPIQSVVLRNSKCNI
jgi:hypothetical protein